MTTNDIDGPPVIEIVKPGYVRLFTEDGDPIDIPADYALAVAAAVEDRRDELEAVLDVDRWSSLARTALAIVHATPLSGLPLLTVDKYQHATDRCTLDVRTEVDLQAIADTYGVPVGAEPRYSTTNDDYAAELRLFAYIEGVKVTCSVTDADLGSALRDDVAVSA